MKFVFLIALLILITTCILPCLLENANGCTDVCTKIYYPVCGIRYDNNLSVEFKSYGNRCMINSFNCNNPTMGMYLLCFTFSNFLLTFYQTFRFFIAFHPLEDGLTCEDIGISSDRILKD